VWLTEKGALSLEAGLTEWKPAYGEFAKRLDPEAARRLALAAEALEEGQTSLQKAASAAFVIVHVRARLAFLACRQPAKPRLAKPSSIMAQVEGSGIVLPSRENAASNGP
jgi:hypothetical protein